MSLWLNIKSAVACNSICLRSRSSGASKFVLYQIIANSQTEMSPLDSKVVNMLSQAFQGLGYCLFLDFALPSII